MAKRFLNILLMLIAAASGTAHADCFDAAARVEHVNPDILRSIAYYESRFDAGALHRNANGTVDIGIMQINSVHLPELRRRGVGSNLLTNAGVNTLVGADLLRKQIQQYGPTWRAVGAYHSRTEGVTEEYARAIHRIYLARPWMKPGKLAEAPHARGLVVENIALR
ncbi:lytic transglycosylase domain-containing protein [Burkholderia ubonensis]|uniref:lytic transglycosylase domain-containing protein n=1 Tax=Burkholderia ubonensis TaxID=101571 RepID=UPI0008FE2528|nr:lytic transglycosylase domain-containing protein [Burkholderia ubonensis]OJA86375.1 lytic transglycosylase [Burkholderia ubonensis]